MPALAFSKHQSNLSYLISNLQSIRMLIGLKVVQPERFLLQCPPSVENIRKDERHEQRHNRHHSQREFTRRGILNGQRALQIDRRRIIRRVVVAGNQKEHRHGKHRSDTGEPNAFIVFRAEYGSENAVEHADHTQ